MGRGTWRSSSPSAPPSPLPFSTAAGTRGVTSWERSGFIPPVRPLSLFLLEESHWGLGEEDTSWDPVTLKAAASHIHPKGLGLSSPTAR